MSFLIFYLSICLPTAFIVSLPLCRLRVPYPSVCTPLTPALLLVPPRWQVLEKRLAEYTFGCLDALGIVNGPSHAEVMWLDSEEAPCLVEVGARPHGSVSPLPFSPCLAFE